LHTQSVLTKLVSKKLIASLQADLSARKGLEKESRDLKKNVETKSSEIEKLKADIARLTTALSNSQTENKTLTAKLVVNRNAAALVESASSKTPGSAMKASGGIRMMGSAETAQQIQAGQLKENIYGDLTGLLIRSVKRETEEDVYDCIQTGRNGSKSSSWIKDFGTDQFCSPALQACDSK
jgi:hypothetical protein